VSRRLLTLSALAALLLLGSAAEAMGQAAVDQYLPSAKPGSQHGSAAHSIAQALAPVTATPPASASGSKRDQRNPAGPVRGPGAGIDEGGGFSLTPFVIIVIVLFLAGLAARYLPRLVRRLRPAHPS
jgi:hypothetical protein